MHYEYCPKCGEKLGTRIAGDEGPVPYCEHCQKFWFDTFGSCSIVLVANEFDEVVLLRQNYLSEVYATLVSGYIKPGETAESTALREVEEEIGIKLDKLEYVRTVWFTRGDLLMHAYVGFTKKCELKLSQEVDAAAWVPWNEAGAKLFPDNPGNASHVCLRHFIKMRGLK